ncbi:scavenger receptor cysteine-rich domain-containing protein DMBT1-like [Rhinoraja longicauda]
MVEQQPRHLVYSFTLLLLRACVTGNRPVPVRLVNGNNMCSGRVEVYHNSTWGTVCGRSWDINAGNVVCRVLNCGAARKRKEIVTDFRKRTGAHTTVYIDGAEVGMVESFKFFGCLLRPSTRSTLPFPVFLANGLGWGFPPLVPQRTSQVCCRGPVPVRLVNGPVPIRLVNGNNMCSGRVEVYHNSTWGHHGEMSVDVASEEGGDRKKWIIDMFKLGQNGKRQIEFTSDKSPVPVRLVNGNNMCSGRVEVYHNSTWGTVCGRSWDINAGNVVCRVLNCPVPIRLVNGNNMCSGRVEVYHNSTWGTVCGRSWDINAGNVVCRVLNCGAARSHHGEMSVDVASEEGGDRKKWIIDMFKLGQNGKRQIEFTSDKSPVPVRLVNGNNMCSGRVEVYHNSTWGTVCGRSWDINAGNVVCRVLNCGAARSDARPSGPVPVRLVNGNNMCSGRVEVYRNTTWGTVCGRSWDINAGNVVCRVLNCGAARSVTTAASDGENTGNIWLDGVMCPVPIRLVIGEMSVDVGSEEGGDRNQWIIAKFQLGQDGNRQIEFNSGKSEVRCPSVWSWDINAGNVVCRVLNCGAARSVTTAASYGEATGNIWMDGVNCSGTEPALDQCPASPWRVNNCPHGEYAGVYCSASEAYDDLILIFTSFPLGASRSWDINAGNVVCRVLNCGAAQSVTTAAFYGEATGNIRMYGVKCNGTEPALDQCHASPWRVNNCDHSEDAEVSCSGPVPVRLVNGSNMCSGRVEVYRNSTWGTVCGRSWDINAGNVVCRVLNCGAARLVTTDASYGEASGNFSLDGVMCNGTEPALNQCPASPWWVNNCTHGGYAGVSCTGRIRNLAQKSCLTETDLQKTRVAGMVEFTLVGSDLCPSDQEVTKALDRLIDSLLSSIPGNSVLDVHVNPERKRKRGAGAEATPCGAERAECPKHN